MDVSLLPIISIITPFLMAFVIGLFKDKYMRIKKILAFVATATSFIATIIMSYPIFSEGKIINYWMGGFELTGGVAIGINLEVDALSALVGLIITLACLLSTIYSFKYMSKDSGLVKYYSLFLLLTGSMIGFVYTGDLFNMYVMLEIMTFAAIALTAFRTAKEKSVEAGFKYLVIGSLGSSFILLGTALLYQQAHTLNLSQLAIVLRQLTINPTLILALALMLVGYAVKSFMVPCHTWPPDAHMSAPSSISMLLSGVMSKTGVYGLIRILFLVFPLVGFTAIAKLVIIWGAITMLVGVSMALLQSDFKRLLAFHSVSQLGYVIVGIGIGLLTVDGIGNLGLMAGLYHMINHATFKCLLFLCAGAILYRTGTTDLSKMSGLSKKMPFTTVLFLIGAAAISGLPPFNGFTSKWLLYDASYQIGMPFITVISLIVSVLTLASFIKVAHSAFFGMEREELKEVKEIPLSMKIPMGVLGALCILFGVFSDFIMNYILKPVVLAIRNPLAYCSALSMDDFTNKFEFNEMISNLQFNIEGLYNPISLLILFFIIVIGILVALSFSANRLGESVESGEINNKMRLELYKDSEDNETFEREKKKIDFEEKARHELFTGGEKEDFSHMGPHDLFWGMKYQFKGYFSRLSDAHSGNVNDYALWVVGTLAVVLTYCFIVFRG